MPKYKIITKATTASAYIVEAKNAKEAEEKWSDGDYNGYRELPDYDIESNEEVLEVNKDDLY